MRQPWPSLAARRWHRWPRSAPRVPCTGCWQTTAPALAEVCEDDVSAFDRSSSTTLHAWREWEVELVDGSNPLLDRIDELMSSLGVALAPTPFKLARVLGYRATPP